MAEKVWRKEWDKFSQDAIEEMKKYSDQTHLHREWMSYVYEVDGKYELGEPSYGDESRIEEVDLRLASNLEDNIRLGTIVAFFTVFSSALGFGAALETLRGNSYRRAQWLSGLALFSRGGVFIGPGLILGGMALNRLAKQQFSDQIEPEE